VAARGDFHRAYTFEKPPGDIHPIGEYIHHRCGGGRALENFDALRARIAGAARQCGDLANAAFEDLIFGRQVTPLRRRARITCTLRMMSL
jgi:hypothetical protein